MVYSSPVLSTIVSYHLYITLVFTFLYSLHSTTLYYISEANIVIVPLQLSENIVLLLCYYKTLHNQPLDPDFILPSFQNSQSNLTSRALVSSNFITCMTEIIVYFFKGGAVDAC